MVLIGVPAALSNRLWARLRARNAVPSFIVFSKSAHCSSLKGCTYLTIITSSGRGEYVTKSGLTLMRYCISIVSKNFWSGTYRRQEFCPEHSIRQSPSRGNPCPLAAPGCLRCLPAKVGRVWSEAAVLLRRHH